MKTFVRLLTLLLALLMLAMTVVACDDGDGDGDDIDRTATEDEFLRERDDLDQYNLNYKGETIKVLGWQSASWDFGVDQITNDNVMMAVYNRNEEVERRLNIKVEYAQANQGGPFISLLESDKLYQMHEYDIVGCYSRTEAELAMRGLLADIASIKDSYLNFEKPWWPNQMVNTVSIGDSIYFVAGDIAPTVLREMQVLYFNKGILAEHWDSYAQQQGVVPEKDNKGQNVVSPAAQMVYNMVYNGSWTLDELIKLTMGPNGNGVGDISQGSVAEVKDLQDTYGFVSITYCLSFFYGGANMRYIENTNDDSILRVSDDYGSMKTVKLVSKLSDWFHKDTCGVDFDKEYRVVMNEGRTMFTAVRARHAMGYSDFEYGVLPSPKYDAKQANYYTDVGNPFTLFGIYNGLDDRGDRDATYSMMSAILECWASECYRLVTPQVFEVNMQLKYADTQCETDMFEIVRSSVSFDLGRIYGPELYGMDDRPILAARAGDSWISTYASYKSPMEKKLAGLVQALQESSGA